MSKARNVGCYYSSGVSSTLIISVKIVHFPPGVNVILSWHCIPRFGTTYCRVARTKNINNKTKRDKQMILTNIYLFRRFTTCGDEALSFDFFRFVFFLRSCHYLLVENVSTISSCLP